MFEEKGAGGVRTVTVTKRLKGRMGERLRCRRCGHDPAIDEEMVPCDSGRKRAYLCKKCAAQVGR